jgi:hypothetical protein
VTAIPTPDTTKGVFVLVTGLWGAANVAPAHGLLIRAGRWEMPVVATSALTRPTDAAVYLPAAWGPQATLSPDGSKR